MTAQCSNGRTLSNRQNSKASQGTLYDVENKETPNPIAVGEYNLAVNAYSEEGIASIQIYANGNQLISEKTGEKALKAIARHSRTSG